MVRRGAVEQEGVRADGGQGPLHDLPRRRRGLLRAGLRTGRRRWRSAATTAATSARTTPSGSRPGRRSRGSPSPSRKLARRRPGESPGGASRVPLPPPAAAASGCCSPPLAWLRARLPRVAGAALRGRVLAARPVHAAGRPRLRLPELPAALGERRLPDDRPPDDPDRGGGDGHRRAARVPDRVLHGEGRLAADAEPARRRGPDAAVGELPRQGLRLADHPAGERDPQLAARAVRALRPGLRERRHLARLHATSGCRS